VHSALSNRGPALFTAGRSIATALLEAILCVNEETAFLCAFGVRSFIWYDGGSSHPCMLIANRELSWGSIDAVHWPEFAQRWELGHAIASASFPSAGAARQPTTTRNLSTEAVIRRAPRHIRRRQPLSAQLQPCPRPTSTCWCRCRRR
jgi:hypothetical protein